MPILRSGTVYVQSESPDTSANSREASPVNVSANNDTTTSLSPSVEEVSGETRPSCDCGNPVATQACMGKAISTNKGRLMYVCARLGEKRCKYFQWMDEPSPRADSNPLKPQRESVPPAAAELPQNVVSSSSQMFPTSPQLESPPRPVDSSSTSQVPLQPISRWKAVYNCNCGKPAIEFLCRNGRPGNIDKYYYRCAEEKCKYWKWIESDEDAQKRINSNKRKRDLNDSDGDGESKKKWRCHCGNPAIRLVSTKGMPHNDGRAFYKCASKKCSYWIWEDGSLPFSEESQALFNDYMDGLIFGCRDDDWW